MHHTADRHFPTLGVIAVVAALVVIAAPATGFGDGFELQHIQPGPDYQHDYLFGPSAQVGDHGDTSARAVLDASGGALVLRDKDGRRETTLVPSQFRFHLLGAVSLYDQFHLGVDVPLFLHQGAQEALPGGIDPIAGGAGLGDIRVVPRARIAEAELDDDATLAFAAQLDAHFPTGDGSRLQGGDLRVGPTFVAEALFDGGHRVGTHLGYQYRPAVQFENLTIDDTIGWGLSTEFEATEEFSAIGELAMRLTPSQLGDSAHNPVEVLAGVQWDVEPVAISGGLGTGLTRGWGAPDWRVFAGAGVPIASAAPPEPEEPPEPTPQPPAEPPVELTSIDQRETLDDFLVVLEGETDPGLDVTVELQLGGEPIETFETTADDEGNFAVEHLFEEDGDYTAVVVAHHDEEPELTGRDTIDFFVAADHCAYAELHDCHEYASCSNISGGMYDCECDDGYEGDGQHCEEAEPEETTAEVDEETQAIEITESIHFETDSDVIEPDSEPVVDDVAELLEDHPELTHVRIEGHTDDRGSRDYNLHLSQQRAESVRDYLIDQGIDAGRLSAEGHGPDNPIADNDTEEGREENRRVEFHIVEREGE